MMENKVENMEHEVKAEGSYGRSSSMK